MSSSGFQSFKIKPLSAAFILTLVSAPAYSAPWYMEKINAPAAHDAGHTGAGVSVAILDDGIDRKNPVFGNRIDSISRNFVAGDPDDLGVDGHGTRVAAFVGARRAQNQAYGIAPDAQIVALRVFAKEGAIADAGATIRAVRYAAESGVRVINGSFGPTPGPSRFIIDPDNAGQTTPNPAYQRLASQPYVLDPRIGRLQPGDVAALRQADKADVLSIFSAANSYLDQPDAGAHPSGTALLPFMQPGNHDKGVYTFIEAGAKIDDPSTYRPISPTDPRLAHLDFSDLQGSLIAVVATDRNNQISSYSNRCGVAWQWCLAAPGGGINADGMLSIEDSLSVPGSDDQHFIGTSASAALVSGSAAVLRGAFPYLTARQTAELLLTTTNTEGRLADRAVYGRGLLDLGRAVQGPREFGAAGFAPVFDVNTKGYDSTWSGDIHGQGGMTKRGFGTLTMTGSNVYTGTTTVAGGTLVVNGSNARSNTLVEFFGRLSGTGTVGTTRVAGTIEPGNAANPLGTLTVAGDYHQADTALYSATITQHGESNLLAVRGHAELNGGTLRVDGISPALLGRQYTLIQAANGITGDFAGKLDDYLFIDLVTHKTADAYIVKVARNSGGFGAVAATANQRAAGSGLDRLTAGNALFDTLIMQNDAAAARSALGQLSGEIHPSVMGSLTNQSGMVRNAVLRRLGQTGVGSKAAWGQYLGSWNHVSGDGNAAAVGSAYNGMLFGADTAVGPSTRLGLALGAGKSDVKANSVTSTAKVDDYMLAAYGESKFGIANLKYGTAYSRHGIDSRRNVAFANAGTSKADYHAHTVQVFSELGTVKRFGRVDLEPYAGVAYVNTRTDAFKESGVAGLQADAASQGATFSTLGLRTRTGWELPKAGVLNLEAGLGWRHAFGDVTPSTRMKFDGGSAFRVGGAPLARDAMLLEAGLAWHVSDRASVGISYAGQLGQGVNDRSAQARAVWRF